jgi:hypothetical protein
MHKYDVWELAGMISRYSNLLRTGRFGDRIPVEARFFASVQTGPGAHPSSCAMCTRSFQGVNRTQRGVNHPPPSSTKVKERVIIPLLPVCVFMACYRVNM